VRGRWFHQPPLSNDSSAKASGCEAPISSFRRFSETEADDFMVGDLRDPYFVRHVIDREQICHRLP
jgi:hypothetical protein